MAKPLCGWTILIAVIAALSASDCRAALQWVQSGKPLAAIIIPAAPARVESYAAKELQYHIEAATGARLPIINEGQKFPPAAHIYLGKTTAASNAQIDPSALPGTRTSSKHSAATCSSPEKTHAAIPSPSTPTKRHEGTKNSSDDIELRAIQGYPNCRMLRITNAQAIESLRVFALRG